jgi:sugar phosphate isomerase/epimerase
VAAVSFHGPYGFECDIGNFDTKGRREAMRKHEEHLQYCSSLGAKYYVIHPGFETYWKNGGGTWDDTKKVMTFPRNENTIGRLWETNAASIVELADFADGLGVEMAFENGPTNMMTPTETINVVRAANRRNVGVCLDTGHVNVGGTVKPADAIREVGPLLRTLHLHDNNADGDFHLAPGMGSIDWVAVGQALRDVAYSGTFNLELPPADWNSEDAWKTMKDSVSFLSRVFK